MINKLSHASLDSASFTSEVTNSLAEVNSESFTSVTAKSVDVWTKKNAHDLFNGESLHHLNIRKYLCCASSSPRLI